MEDDHKKDDRDGAEPKQENGSQANAGYAVGYGKPPRHARFRKGQSGNPKGRPKGKSLNMDSIMEIVRSKLEARHAMNIDGKMCERTLMEVSLDNFLRQFASNPARHWKQVLPLIERAYTERPHEDGRDYAAEVRRKLEDMAEAWRIANEAAEREAADNTSERPDRDPGDNTDGLV